MVDALCSLAFVAAYEFGKKVHTRLCNLSFDETTPSLAFHPLPPPLVSLLCMCTEIAVSGLHRGEYAPVHSPQII